MNHSIETAVNEMSNIPIITVKTRNPFTVGRKKKEQMKGCVDK